MNYFLAILAGAVQGLTEFLPISSTAHLIIFQKIFSIPAGDFGLAFDASLHLGTLAAVLIFFAKDFIQMYDLKKGLFLKLIVGTIPAVFLGLLLQKYIESSFRNLLVVGLALIIFSFVMLLAETIGKKVKTMEKTNILEAFVIGIFQSIALIPGISRSGATISAGLFLGLRREEAARFAFMLSAPIIAGAGLKEFLSVINNSTTTQTDIQFFVLGIVSSFIFGYITIKYFLLFLTKNNLNIFIIYRIALGVILITASFF